MPHFWIQKGPIRYKMPFRPYDPVFAHALRIQKALISSLELCILKLFSLVLSKFDLNCLFLRLQL